MRKILTVLLVLATLLLIEGVVLAAERVTNGTFEADVSGWTASSSTVVYTSTLTYNGSAGSAKVTNTSGSTSASSAGASQCVDIPTPDVGAYFTAKGWIYVPSDEPANFSYAYIRVRYYGTNDCSGTALGSNIDSSQAITPEVWQEVTAIAAVPVAAESAQFRLYIRKADNTANPYAYFDDVTFYDSTPTDVTVSSMASSSPFFNLTAALFVAAGLVVLRKRR